MTQPVHVPDDSRNPALHAMLACGDVSAFERLFAAVPTRGFTADEEVGLNDLYHEIGCGCPECRPDMHDDLERCPVTHNGLGSPEAA